MLQAKKINCNQTCISCVTGVTGVVRVAEVRQLRHVTFDAKSLVSTGVRSNTVVVDCATVWASRPEPKLNIGKLRLYKLFLFAVGCW